VSLIVVVVEDHVEAAQGLGELIEMWGHRAHLAYDGESGLELVQAVRPDVALVDIGLPVMDGAALAAKIRDLEIGRGMYLVALTGYRESEAVSAHFDRRLEKPVPLEVLEHLLAERAAPGR